MPKELPAKKMEARKLFEQNVPGIEIAKQLGVSTSAVSKWCLDLSETRKAQRRIRKKAAMEPRIVLGVLPPLPKKHRQGI